jgi:hypothetical protein
MGGIGRRTGRITIAVSGNKNTARDVVCLYRIVDCSFEVGHVDVVYIRQDVMELRYSQLYRMIEGMTVFLFVCADGDKSEGQKEVRKLIYTSRDCCLRSECFKLAVITHPCAV